MDDVAGLERFALDVLEGLRLEDGLYCFDKDWASHQLRGRSLRYTLMVALGVSRYATVHGGSPVDAGSLVASVADEREGLGVGDLSLLLLCLQRTSDLRGHLAQDVVRLLQLRAAHSEAVASLPGMEIAWFVWASAVAYADGACPRSLFDLAWRNLEARRSARTPLLRHIGTDRGRARFPNFATEIYSVLALTEVARRHLTPDAGRWARQLADLLIELRRPDAAWPWLYHAERGTVVEPYELYSVHQDAMAPMALFALAEVTGEADYAVAAVEGHRFCFGQNELQLHFYDVVGSFAHRSIKRRGVAHRANLWGNTGLATVGRVGTLDVGSRSVNTTCRPYHLGWILEAWSGREAHVSLLAEDDR